MICVTDLKMYVNSEIGYLVQVNNVSMFPAKLWVVPARIPKRSSPEAVLSATLQACDCTGGWLADSRQTICGSLKASNTSWLVQKAPQSYLAVQIYPRLALVHLGTHEREKCVKMA